VVETTISFLFSYFLAYVSTDPISKMVCRLVFVIVEIALDWIVIETASEDPWTPLLSLCAGKLLVFALYLSKLLVS
jgi:hypothetical protein